MKFKFFALGRKIALKSTYRHQLACVIVKKNKVLSTGFNKANKTHPKSAVPFNTVHAELAAILSAKSAEIRGADAYVYREYKTGLPAMAKPCIHCMELLRQVGVANVYFTTDAKPNWEVLKIN